MSRALSIKSIAAASVLAGALALALSGTALARGGGGHGGGGHGGGGHGGGHFGGGHGGFHSFHAGGSHVAHFSSGRHFSSHTSRSFVSRHGVAAGVAAGAAGGAIAHNAFQGNHVSDRTAAHNANAVHNALVSHQVTNALHHGGLRDPASRAAITAAVAHGAWHNHGGGWWRHNHGGYGWVGPVFWPYAYWDMYDYAFWGYGYDPGFWDYGYADLYGGMFGMYDYGTLSGYSGYLPRRGSNATAPAPGSDQATLADMCGEDTHDIAGLPVDRIRDTLQLNDDQRAALDLLATASQNASQSIRNSCPGDVALTAPARLATMQQRIEAMRTAINSVTPPLDKFYSLLTDEQKAKFNGMAAEQPRTPRETPATTTASTGNCDTSQPGATDWPGALIESSVRPTDAQRASLTKLQDATNKAAEILKTSCQPAEARTPPARFEAIAARLDTMDKAIGTVRPALDDFYGSLSDEQKAAFDAIGPQRAGSPTASVSDDGTPSGRHHRRHGVSVGRMIRHMIGFM